MITDFGQWFYFYVSRVVTTSGLGCLTFGVLVLITNYYSRKNLKTFRKRFYIQAITQAAILINSLVVCTAMDTGISWLRCWLSYAIVMGISIKYFIMEPTIYSDETAVGAEVVE